MRLHLIGDIHGKQLGYERVLASLPKGEPSIQLGDFGHGFKEFHAYDALHRHIRGNHDSPAKALAHPNYLGEYGYIEEYDAFYFGGAWSIDWMHRVPGISWWKDEEQSDEAMARAMEVYVQERPRTVLSHECPAVATPILLKDLLQGKDDEDSRRKSTYFKEKEKCAASRTARFLDSLLLAHQPNHWFFGHYHIDKDFLVEGSETVFSCLAELSVSAVKL